MMEERVQQPIPATQQLSIAQNASHPHNNHHPHNQNGSRRPIDAAVFSPEAHHMKDVKNFRLTPQRKYGIVEKKQGLMLGSETYVVLDNDGREQEISDIYFTPGNVQLYADRELGFSETGQQRDGGKLFWGGANSEPDMPNIRR